MMYEFNLQNGWREIKDFLITEETSDCEQERLLAGFTAHPAFTVGDSESHTFAISIYTRFNAEKVKGNHYKYLAEMEIGGEITTVAIDTLPDLMEFLRQNASIVATIDDNFFKRRRYLESIEATL